MANQVTQWLKQARFRLGGGKGKIYGIGADHSGITVKSIEDGYHLCRIIIYINYVPGVISNLKEALVRAEFWTKVVAEKAVKIFGEYGIRKDVAVWAQLPLGVIDNKAAILGRTWYSSRIGRYIFEHYEPFRPKSGRRSLNSKIERK